MSVRLSRARLATLARLGVLVVQGDWDALARARAELEPAEVDRALRETLLQVGVFAGMPRLVHACAVLGRVGGLGDALAEEREGGLEAAALLARGEALFALVYGDTAGAVREGLAAAHPELERLVLGQAYGAVLARPGLETADRELLAVAWLAALDQERQLASHARGALRSGATAEEVVAVLEAVRDRLGEDLHQRAARVAERFGGP